MAAVFGCLEIWNVVCSLPLSWVGILCGEFISYQIFWYMIVSPSLYVFLYLNRKVFEIKADFYNVHNIMKCHETCHYKYLTLVSLCIGNKLTAYYWETEQESIEMDGIAQMKFCSFCFIFVETGTN